MVRLKPVDVVIVGGGWTGLAMARELVGGSSLSVVVLERGPSRTLADYSASMDEVDYAIRHRMMQNIAEETVTHRFTIRDPAAPIRQYGNFLPGTGVGGSGEHWTGIAERHVPEDFILGTLLREKYGSRLPADLAVQDYGVTYEDLEPYYWRAEQMMGVGGQAGNVQGKLIEGGNPYEGVRSHHYPNPPHKTTYAMTLFVQAARELGYHPYPSPAATLTQEYTNPDGVSRMACQYCGYCMLFGCMVGAKSQPSNTLLPVLRNKKTFDLRTESWVRRIVHRNGKAEGVQYMDGKGQEVMQPAHMVVLASFTPNNTRLLLLSKIGDPYDPVAGKGTLGRNFTHTVGGGGGAVILDKPLNGFMNAGGQGIRLSDFAGFRGLDPDSGVLRGGLASGGGGGGHPIASFGRIPPGTAPRNWGSQWKKAALEYHDRMTGVGGFEMDHLAYKHNFLDLDPTYTDKWGDPLLRLTIDWTEHEQRQREFASKVGAKLAQEVARISGGRVVTSQRTARSSRHYQTAGYATTHLQGGAIMGRSPDSSVVNTWLQHWHMANLWVIGGSAFPQNSAYHPTLTSIALTYRAADAMIHRYLKHPGALA
ncbi:MAG TPA: GMC family oxidoreductase [Bryobacteraceae bacterium]|nr:GMC family oxidoreductase [Bryobacteraceae bacterium]